MRGCFGSIVTILAALVVGMFLFSLLMMGPQEIERWSRVVKYYDGHVPFWINRSFTPEHAK